MSKTDKGLFSVRGLKLSDLKTPLLSKIIDSPKVQTHSDMALWILYIYISIYIYIIYI